MAFWNVYSGGFLCRLLRFHSILAFFCQTTPFELKELLLLLQMPLLALILFFWIFLLSHPTATSPPSPSKASLGYSEPRSKLFGQIRLTLMRATTIELFSVKVTDWRLRWKFNHFLWRHSLPYMVENFLKYLVYMKAIVLCKHAMK